MMDIMWVLFFLGAMMLMGIFFIVCILMVEDHKGKRNMQKKS